jgi:hypothetical protein
MFVTLGVDLRTLTLVRAHGALKTSINPKLRLRQEAAPARSIGDLESRALSDTGIKALHQLAERTWSLLLKLESRTRAPTGWREHFDKFSLHPLRQQYESAHSFGTHACHSRVKGLVARGRAMIPPRVGSRVIGVQP